MGRAARPLLPSRLTPTVVMPTMLALSTSSAPWAGTNISGRAGPTDRTGRPFHAIKTPNEDATRGRVTELRRQGLSVYEISARLAAEGTGLRSEERRVGKEC